LSKQNGKLESDRVIQADSESELKADLEGQRARADFIERELKAYKEKHTLSGDLGALQAAVSDLQEQRSGQDSCKKFRFVQNQTRTRVGQNGGRSYKLTKHMRISY
jgi:hypothetical protein